jgi:hypothetical protein
MSLWVLGQPEDSTCLVVARRDTAEADAGELSRLLEVTSPARTILLDAVPGPTIEAPVPSEVVRVIPGGLIAGVNRVMDGATERYLAVIHGRVVIEEPGWLAHACAFLGSRDDAALVGLGGWHAVDEEGMCRGLAGDAGNRGWRADAPAWRFTRAAAADLGCVVRASDGLRLDESFGDDLSHALVDLCLARDSAGGKVYALNVDISVGAREPRAAGDPKIASRWGGLLPLECDHPDERESAGRIGELNDELLTLADLEAEMSDTYRQVLAEHGARKADLELVEDRARSLESQIAEVRERSQALKRRLAGLEARRRSPGEEGR